MHSSFFVMTEKINILKTNKRFSKRTFRFHQLKQTNDKGRLFLAEKSMILDHSPLFLLY